MGDALTPVPEQLSASTRRGALWNSLAYWASKLALLPTTVVLARLLSPEEFGLVALALLVVTYLDVLRQFGIASALIQWPDDDDVVISVAFWLSLIAGILIAVGATVIAPVIASFFRQPELTTILRVLALVFVVDSVAGIYEALLRKRLQFRRRVAPELGRALVKGVSAIVLATLGFGAWSLVLGQVAGSLVAAALYWSASRPTPLSGFDWAIARSLCRYGAQYATFAVLAVVVKDIDYLIIGRRMSADALGYYTLAFRLPELAILGTCYVFSETLFPVFSKLQADPARLATAFARAVRLLVLVTLPLGVGMALVAPELVPVMFSAKWVPAVPAMQWLALYASVLAIGFVAGDVYKAVGRTGLLNVLALGKLAVTVPVIWLAGSRGIDDVARAHFGIACVVVTVEVFVVLRILHVPLATLLGHVLPVVGAVLIMACSVLLGRWLVPGGSPVGRLVAFVAIGASTYAAAVWVLARNSVLDILRTGGKGALRDVAT